MWLLLTETCQGRAWQWCRGLNHWDSNQTLLGGWKSRWDTGRSVPGTPKQAVLLRRDAREEMGQRQVSKGWRAEARRKERSAAVAMKLCTEAALPSNAGDSVALPAGQTDFCFLLTTKQAG